MKKVVKLLISLTIIAILLSLVYIFFKNEAKKQRDEEILAAFAEYYDNKIQQYEKENAKLSPGEIDVVFLGDSLTDGCDLALYYPEYKTLNRGIGGDTTFGLEKRLQVSVFDVQPKVCVMLIGANIFSNMFENYENILISLKENLSNTEIILVSLTSMGGNWGKNNHIAAFNNVKIKALSEKYNFEYVDVYTPLLNMETNEIYPEYTTDGGHLTHQGYLVLTGKIKTAIAKLLSEK
jgi:lysophospholipase L1-like esterase